MKDDVSQWLSDHFEARVVSKGAYRGDQNIRPERRRVGAWYDEDASSSRYLLTVLAYDAWTQSLG